MLLRRTQEESARYLPPKTELVVCCRLTQLQQELYLTLLDSKVAAERADARCTPRATTAARTALSMRYVTLLGKACTHPKCRRRRLKPSTSRPAGRGDAAAHIGFGPHVATASCTSTTATSARRPWRHRPSRLTHGESTA